MSTIDYLKNSKEPLALDMLALFRAMERLQLPIPKIREDLTEVKNIASLWYWISMRLGDEGNMIDELRRSLSLLTSVTARNNSRVAPGRVDVGKYSIVTKVDRIDIYHSESSSRIHTWDTNKITRLGSLDGQEMIANIANNSSDVVQIDNQAYYIGDIRGFEGEESFSSSSNPTLFNLVMNKWLEQNYG